METQQKELAYFTDNEELYAKYFNICLYYYKNEKGYHIIFNRQACIFTLEEILNSENIDYIENYQITSLQEWENIIKYYLAVNHEITHISNEKDENDVSFESLNPKLIPLNELSIEADPILIPYRGCHLITYFENNEHFSNELKEYYQEFYNVEPEEFIFNILGMYLSNSSDIPEHNFLYLVTEEGEDIFKKMSIRVQNNETYKLLNIRKSPFINVGKLKNLLADNSFLIEKTFSQFLN